MAAMRRQASLPSLFLGRKKPVASSTTTMKASSPQQAGGDDDQGDPSAKRRAASLLRRKTTKGAKKSPQNDPTVETTENGGASSSSSSPLPSKPKKKKSQGVPADSADVAASSSSGPPGTAEAPSSEEAADMGDDDGGSKCNKPTKTTKGAAAKKKTKVAASQSSSAAAAPPSEGDADRRHRHPDKNDTAAGTETKRGRSKTSNRKRNKILTKPSTGETKNPQTEEDTDREQVRRSSSKTKAGKTGEARKEDTTDSGPAASKGPKDSSIGDADGTAKAISPSPDASNEPSSAAATTKADLANTKDPTVAAAAKKKKANTAASKKNKTAEAAPPSKTETDAKHHDTGKTEGSGTHPSGDSHSPMRNGDETPGRKKNGTGEKAALPADPRQDEQLAGKQARRASKQEESVGEDIGTRRISRKGRSKSRKWADDAIQALDDGETKELLIEALPLVPLSDPKSDDGGSGNNGVRDGEAKEFEQTANNQAVSSPAEKKKMKVNLDEAKDAAAGNLKTPPPSPRKVKSLAVVEERLSHSLATKEDTNMEEGVTSKVSSPAKNPSPKGNKTARQRSLSPKKKVKERSLSPKKKVKKSSSETETRSSADKQLAKETESAAVVVSLDSGPESEVEAVDSNIGGNDAANADVASKLSSSPELPRVEEKAIANGIEGIEKEQALPAFTNHQTLDDESSVTTAEEAMVSPRQASAEKVDKEDAPPTVPRKEVPGHVKTTRVATEPFEDDHESQRCEGDYHDGTSMSNDEHNETVCPMISTKNIVQNGKTSTTVARMDDEQGDGGPKNDHKNAEGKLSSQSSKEYVAVSKPKINSAIGNDDAALLRSSSNAMNETLLGHEGGAIASDVNSEREAMSECPAAEKISNEDSLAHRASSIHLTISKDQEMPRRAIHGSDESVEVITPYPDPKISRQEACKSSPAIPSNDGMDKQRAKELCQAKIDMVVSMLSDKSKKETVEGLIVRIQAADGFPQVRRLSVRDNDIVQSLTRTISSDPSIVEIKIDSDVRFEHTTKALVIAFGEGMRSNLHLKCLTMTGLFLGNDFLSALATSMELNFVLTKIDLSNNNFTNEGLTEFCQALGTNGSCQEINLKQQQSKIFESSHEGIFEALEMNRSLLDLKVDFHSKPGEAQLAAILKRNKENGQPSKDIDDKLVEFLSHEAELAEYLWRQRKAEENMVQSLDEDWGYLYELSILHDKFKSLDDSKHARVMVKGTNSVPTVRGEDDTPLHTLSLRLETTIEETNGFTPDGSFLTAHFVSRYLKEGEGALTFDFCGQWKLFKRFPATDPARKTIVTKLVAALVEHPRSKDITDINMANSCLGSDFFVTLADRCLGDKSMLLRVRSINAETNYLTEPGIVALAKCISDPDTLRHLQSVKLENQKTQLSSKAEFALARAMCVNRSVIAMSLRVRNLLERQQINNYVVRNIDFLRQARRRNAIETGTLQKRKRNEMEIFFDRIESNDPSITQVEIVGSQKFKGLSDDEKVKAAEAFARNTHVKVVIMSALGLDDRFAQALGESLASNNTIEKLSLDSNSISGVGLKELFSGLAKNSSVSDMQARHQSKKTGSGEEDLFPDILEPNKSVIKLGIDLRSSLAKMKIDRKMSQNREHQRKLRCQSKKGVMTSETQ